MSGKRKISPTAKLKKLPPERQASIVEMASGMSLREAVKQLAQDGISVSIETLSNFLSWYHLEQRFADHQDEAETFMQMIAAQRPELNRDQVFSYGQDFFSLLAMKAQDPKEWARIQKLGQKEMDLRFQREKFKEALKSDIERALDALFQEVKGNPVALEYFEKFKTAIQEAAK